MVNLDQLFYINSSRSGTFSCFLSSVYFVCLFVFFKINFSKTYFRNTIRVFNILEPDQVQRILGPNLGSNCFQKLSAGDISVRREPFSLFHHSVLI